MMSESAGDPTLSPAPTTVVTGAARGIGAAVARRFAGAGHRLLLVDIDPAVADVATELGPDRARAVTLDVTDPAAWQTALAANEDWLDQLHGLIACAGVLGPADPVTDLSVEDWEKVLHVNLTGVFVASQAVAGRMVERGVGRIVAMASMAGKEGNPGQAAYSASKGGVIAFTKSLAKELAESGVTVNCIAPTAIEGEFSAAMSEETRAGILRKIPMNRFGRAEEVAELIAWVCSPECSFTTGFCFDLSGGRATY